MTEIRSYRCIVRWRSPCVDIMAGSYTDLDGLAYYTPRPDGVTCCSSATAYTACTKQQEIKSRTRENDAIKRCGQHKMYEAAACGITRHTVLQPTFL